MKMMDSQNDKTTMTTSLLVLTSGLVVVLLGIGCGDNSQKDPDAGPDPDAEVVCTPGVFADCDGDDAIVCDIDGSSMVRVACGSAGCNADMERCNDCVPGSGRVCYEGNIAECSSHGEELSSESCSYGCTQIGGTATCNECHADQTECQGDVLVTCGGSGTIDTSETCDHGCSSERAACNDCPPLEVGCNGDELVACDAEGLIEESETCAFGCSDDLLACLCNAGGATCDGDVLRTCSASGIPESAEWCQNGCGSDGATDWCQECDPQVPQFCDGADLMACDSTGHLGLIETCPLGCNAWTTPQRCYTFAPMLLADTDLLVGTTDLIVDAVMGGANFDTGGSGDVPTLNFIPLSVGSYRVITQQPDGAPDLVVVYYRDITVTNTTGIRSIRVSGSRGIALVASRDIQIGPGGEVKAAAANGTPGGGGQSGISTDSHVGRGVDSVDTPSCEFASPGAGGGGHAGVGGAGGTVATEPGGAGGAAIPVDPTQPALYGGARGGATPGATQTSGAGGGVVMLVARRSISIYYTNLANFSYGGVFVDGSGGNGDGAGGGSGGSVLIEAPSVFISGRLSALGGGGACGISPGGADGYRFDGVGCSGTVPSLSGGDGAGAAGTVNGESAPTASGCGANQGGGGGGAAGRITINVSPFGGGLVLDGTAEFLGATDYGYIQPF